MGDVFVENSSPVAKRRERSLVGVLAGENSPWAMCSIVGSEALAVLMPLYTAERS